MVIASGEGGVDIEETAAKHPEKIVKRSLSIEELFYGFDALEIAKQIGIPQRPDQRWRGDNRRICLIMFKEV